MSAADRSLIARVAADADADAFALLVDRHRDMVFAACARILGNAADAEEAAQICFFRLLKNAANLRGSVAAWLHGVAVRVSIDMIRRAETRRAREKEAGLLRLSEEQHDWAELRAAVDAEIARLSESLRAALVLHYLERRPQREIAEELGVTQPRVSQLVHEALSALRKALGRKGWTGPLAVLTAFMAERTAEAAPATLAAALGKMAMAGLGGSASVATGAGAAASTTAAAGTAGGTGTIGGLGLMKLTAIAVAAATVITAGGIGIHNALSQNKAPPPAQERPARATGKQPAPVLTQATLPQPTADDLLLRSVLELDKLVQAEKQARGDAALRTSCQVIEWKDEAVRRGAVIFEAPLSLFGERYSKENRTLTIGRTGLSRKLSVYDSQGLEVPYAVRDVQEHELTDGRTSRTGFLDLKLPDAAVRDDTLRLVMVMESDKAVKFSWREETLWRIATGNSSPESLNYYQVILPPSAVFVESWPAPLCVHTRDGRTAVTIRQENRKSGESFHLAYLWPEKDGTTLTDLPKEYRGLRDLRDTKLAEEYERQMAIIRKATADMAFNDLSAPVNALLTWRCAIAKKDLKLYSTCHYSARKNPERIAELAPDEDTTSYFVDGMTFLSTPEWPEEPEEGYIHPVYMAFPGTLLRRDIHAVIFHEGQWLVLGNIGNCMDTDVSVFEKFK